MRTVRHFNKNAELLCYSRTKDFSPPVVWQTDVTSLESKLAAQEQRESSTLKHYSRHSKATQFREGAQPLRSTQKKEMSTIHSCNKCTQKATQGPRNIPNFLVNESSVSVFQQPFTLYQHTFARRMLYPLGEHCTWSVKCSPFSTGDYSLIANPQCQNQATRIGHKIHSRLRPWCTPMNSKNLH